MRCYPAGNRQQRGPKGLAQPYSLGSFFCLVGASWIRAAERLERRPHWGDLYYKDHIKLARAGGVRCKRGTDRRGVTIAMPLFPLAVLPLRDLLRVHHEKIEAWILEQAGIVFDATAEPGALRVVAA